MDLWGTLLTFDMGGSCPLWVAPYPEQAVLGCIRKLGKYELWASQQAVFLQRFRFKFLPDSLQ